MYDTLGALEAKLATQRFILPTAQPTAADLRLVMTLLRWDVAYRNCFGLRGGRGGILLADAAVAAEGAKATTTGYPAVAGYVRDVYQRLAPTVDWAAFVQYYRWTKGHPPTAPLPDVARIVESAQRPHGRGAM